MSAEIGCKTTGVNISTWVPEPWDGCLYVLQSLETLIRLWIGTLRRCECWIFAFKAPGLDFCLWFFHCFWNFTFRQKKQRGTDLKNRVSGYVKVLEFLGLKEWYCRLHCSLGSVIKSALITWKIAPEFIKDHLFWFWLYQYESTNWLRSLINVIVINFHNKFLFINVLLPVLAALKCVEE